MVAETNVVVRELTRLVMKLEFLCVYDEHIDDEKVEAGE